MGEIGNSKGDNMEKRDKFTIMTTIGCAIIFWAACLAVLVPVIIKLWKWALN